MIRPNIKDKAANMKKATPYSKVLSSFGAAAFVPPPPPPPAVGGGAVTCAVI